MRKTDKKLDNKLRKTLTEVCNFASDNIDGYQWISHQVNFDFFPNSLVISCVFNSKESIGEVILSGQEKVLKALIVRELNEVGIKINDINKQIKLIVDKK